MMFYWVIWTKDIWDLFSEIYSHFIILFFFTFDVLVPEFLMQYSPSCGGMGLSLNNLQVQASPHVTSYQQRHINAFYHRYVKYCVLYFKWLYWYELNWATAANKKDWTRTRVADVLSLLPMCWNLSLVFKLVLIKHLRETTS